MKSHQALRDMQAVVLEHRDHRNTYDQLLLDLMEAILLDISQLQTDIQTLTDAVGTAATELQDLAMKVHSLVNQGPSNVTQADLDALDTGVASATKSLADAVSSAVTTAGEGPTPPPSPSPEPGPTPAPTPGPEPVPPPTPGPVESGLSLYTYDGQPGSENPAEWPPTDLVTTDTPPRPLFTFSGDTAPGQANGDGLNGQWHVYTEATQPVSQSVSGPEASATEAGTPPQG